jgi:hypothetical protein
MVVVSPANKDRPLYVQQLALKIQAFLDAGVHVLLIDLLPPGPYDPRGLHGAVGPWLEGTGLSYVLPIDEPSTLASCRAFGWREAYLEHLAVGSPLPDMPLFIDPGHYVNVPLEMTYAAAFAAMPQFHRDLLERPTAGGR